MKRLTLTLLVAWLLWGMGWAQTNDLGNRALWASINRADNASLGDYKQIVNRKSSNSKYMYDLQGHRMQIPKRGLFIINNKKVFIRP